MKEPYTSGENGSVYKLLSKLCERTAQYYCQQSRVSVKQLASKMRSQSYEILLNKSKIGVPISNSDPIVDLLSCQFTLQQKVTNVAEYKHAVELKKSISTIKKLGLDLDSDYVYTVVRVLIGIHSIETHNLSSELHQRPFSFGLLEEMLPKPNKEFFGSPQPYSLYPSYIFHLPFKLNSKDTSLNCRKDSFIEYTVTNFDSSSLVQNCNTIKNAELKSFLTPISLSSATSTQVSPYSECDIYNLPRLTTPRDLIIPKATVTPKISFPKTEEASEANSNCKELNELNIWELASQVDKDIPVDIWDIVSKLPSINERQLIATSSREMRLWRQTFGSMTDYSVISERKFIRHITYLLIGIETRSFPLNEQTNSFRLKYNLVLECISRELLEGYVAPLLIIGTFYRRLYEFAFNYSVDHDKGLVYEAARETVRLYLLKFRLQVTNIFEEFSNTIDDVNCMPTLLHILHHIEPLKYEIQTVASIYKLDSLDANIMPYGAELMAYLFNEISLVTHKRTAETLYNSLFSVCRVYFKFIEKFIFEGELDDYFNEFFIRKDNQYVNSRSKRYWDKGFHITLGVAVPDFLRPLASCILLCGKSLRLLKLCNPTDPLILISTDHPSVRCCSNFEELEREQQLLDVYRTRCLFVSGEPVTFDQILLKREAERKAFTEMASLKQAETMEKIVAERKRLAQLIIAEKQHSLRVLEAAMAEAKASKNRVKHREKHILQLEEIADKGTEEVDSKLKDDEKNKMLEYYSKLNMEVEKSKIHTEWKIKRLQLDQTRMQLLSSEERNLKREKLELEHQKNEEIMAMSIQSDFKSEDGLDEMKMVDSTSSLGEANSESEVNINRTKSQTSNDVFNAICANKHNFRTCDNEIQLDAQGNIVNTENKESTSSDVIGGNLNEAFDNQRFLEGREEALKNKFKVMAHEFGDNNNPIITLTAIDEENNISTPFKEARRNKLKVLGEFDTTERKDKIYEPTTDAQKEAVINKKKVLGAEFGKSEPIDQTRTRNEVPITEAQREAIINKQRVLGAEFDKTDSIEKEVSAIPRNDAQREAVLNKQKVLGTEFENTDSIMKGDNISEPRNDAQREAIINKQRVLGAEFGQFEHVYTSDSRVFGESRTEAQKEALINKQKVMGVEYNLPLERMVEREPANIAQTEALRNKSNIMGSEHYGSKSRVDVKKSGLKLNLKPFGDCSNTGAVTPGELFPGLDLETPTTAEMPMDGPMTSDIFTPRSEDILEKPEKDYLRPEFDFSIIVDEAPSISDQTSPMKDDEKTTLNVLNGSYSLENFDPFGVKISKKLEYHTEISYSDPAKIFEEMKKTPYKNIYKTSIDEDEWIVCGNIATLTACLQRSVMLPLTYQLEVVNNSILTHFLVNLDMYEHLKSLKDYFFLMDGEFSRSICNNLFAKLTKTLNPQELLNFSTLHNILDKALGSSISHVHKFSENLSFSIPDVPLSFQHSSPDVLQCLSLTYTVTWPLNIIISQEALLRYAKVFQFLIKMRRIFWVLSQDFELLKLSVKLSPHSRKLLRSPQYISVQLYRHIMASLIRALDNYIVTTCILTSWTEFEKDLKKAKTLDDLYECHVVYIKNVLFRCLLNNRSTPVMKLLNDIFTVILKFSRVLKAGEWQQREENGHFTHTNFAQLEELYHLYEKLTKYLHKVITKLMECGYQRHLVELLTMVNLNGYYDPERHDNTSSG
ncbi:gamma-tubulin complex component 6 [Pieris brassicae]|uniref:gamma-tubulin complex component 6 n=1 Tax=Pieris brassicae TaxID=7116 RepID=UPI001E65FE5D|nr:gamma-tubulin complex component 6 [Pieris brassicae]